MSIEELQVVDSMQLEVTGRGLKYLDFYGDETCIVVGFRRDHGVLVSIRTK